MDSFDYKTADVSSITDKVILGIIDELEAYVYVNLNSGDVDDIAKNIGSKARSRSQKEQDILRHKINGRVNLYLQSDDKTSWQSRYNA